MSQSRQKFIFDEVALVMPMAGRGSRMELPEGSLPKPLLPLQGLPLYRWAMASLKGLSFSATGIVREEDSAAFAGESAFCRLISTPILTKGPAHSALLAEPFVPASAKLLILDCDLWFDAPEFINGIQTMISASGEVGAGLLCTFESQNPNYSYVRSVNGSATSIHEKKCISSSAVLGAYFFSKAGDFFRKARQLVDGNPRENEIYVSHVVQSLLEEGFQFGAVPSRRHLSFGTAVDLNSNNHLLPLATAL